MYSPYCEVERCWLPQERSVYHGGGFVEHKLCAYHHLAWSVMCDLVRIWAPMPRQRCGNCKWWRAEMDWNRYWGKCRVNPPQIVTSGRFTQFGVRPDAHKGDVCSMWTGRD